MKLVPVLLSFAIAAVAHAQPTQPDRKVDAAATAQVIEASIAALRARYVFPDVAAKIETAMRAKVASHTYDRVTSARELAKLLTSDLQAISHDKHMRLRFHAEPVPDFSPPESEPNQEDKAQLHQFAERKNGFFIKVERMDGNIGYLRLDAFLPPAETAARFAAAMTLLASTDALILDLRDNMGGDPAAVAVLVSYLYDAYDEIHINDIYTHPTRSTRPYWNVQSLPAPRYAGKPVYVLTSRNTFSGGEECAYDLQALKRATLIGEVTGGGANPGGPVKVGEHFELFVPIGRAVNPVTKTNWEGVGVKPDIAVPAAKALDRAYLEALRHERARITAKDAPELSDEIDQALAKLEGKRS